MWLSTWFAGGLGSAGLDLMIVEISSNFTDSMVLQGYFIYKLQDEVSDNVGEISIKHIEKGTQIFPEVTGLLLEERKLFFISSYHGINLYSNHITDAT